MSLPEVGTGLIAGGTSIDPAATGIEGTATPGFGVAAHKRLGWVFWVAAGWVVLVILAAIFAGLLPLQDPSVPSALPGLDPSGSHLLGTDELGRDLLSRVVYGSRVSLIVGFSSIALGLAVGGMLGLLAGYYRGFLDSVITGAANILLAFPALVLGLAIVTFWGPSLFHVTIAIAILSIAPLTLVVRGSTVIYSEREFVSAARMLGASNRPIILREIFPNVVPAAVSLGLISVAVAIVAEGGLSFLGLSVRAPTPTWGNMIAEGQAVIGQHPLIALWPGLAMFLTVLALNIAGDRLRGYFDIKEGGL
ncbi:MAG TPA: ABC transporter permease [Acidimicrobiales bacterium]|nr:ABC transporter permease [Acidimicrobiales bacterium]